MPRRADPALLAGAEIFAEISAEMFAEISAEIFAEISAAAGSN